MTDNRNAAPSLQRLTRLLSALSTAALWLAGIGPRADDRIRRLAGVRPLRAQPLAELDRTGSVMLMSWFIFLGAAVGVRENNHMGFDVLLYVLPRGGKRVLRMISDLVILAFGIGMIWYGSQLVALTWNSTLPSLGISGGVRLFPGRRRRRAGLHLCAGAHRVASCRRPDRRRAG